MDYGLKAIKFAASFFQWLDHYDDDFYNSDLASPVEYYDELDKKKQESLLKRYLKSEGSATPPMDRSPSPPRARGLHKDVPAIKSKANRYVN